MLYDDETNREMEIAEHCGSGLMLATLCGLSGFAVGFGLALLVTKVF